MIECVETAVLTPEAKVRYHDDFMTLLHKHAKRRLRLSAKIAKAKTEEERKKLEAKRDKLDMEFVANRRRLKKYYLSDYETR